MTAARKGLWLIAVIVPLALTFLHGVGILSSADYLNNKIIDRFFIERPVQAPVVIIAIDDRSIQTIGRWPWDRSVHARLLDRLAAAPPAVVAFDVDFFERSNQAPDQALARAMAHHRVILSHSAGQLDPSNGNVAGVIDPIPLLGQSSKRLGFVNMLLDRDGILRSVYPIYKQGSEQPGGPILGVAALLEGCDKFSLSCARSAVDGGWEIPYLPKHFRIAFTGPPGHIPTVSYADVLAGRINPTTLKDKIVFIGATAPDLHDLFLVPTSNGTWMPGVEVHAHIADTIWSRSFFREVGTGTQLLLALLLALVIAFLFRRTHKISFLILMTLLLMAVVNIAIAVAFEGRIIFHLVFLNLVMLFTFIAELGYVYVVEGRQRRFIEGAFKPYVSEKILKVISENPNALALGGEKRMITLLFSDIRGFTTISEKTGPEVLGHVLNEYFQAMSEIILAEGGLIDKFIGDAIMAIWGAPLADEQQAERACRVALKLMQRSHQLQAEFAAKGWPKIEIGIGINTGVAVVGNFGSRERFSYTAVGDTVNLASRLENANKEFNTNIVISEFTKQQLPSGQFQLRSLGLVKVRGKEQGVEVFELLS